MISIITPVRAKDEQHLQWLHECIASVQAQPGEWEHIVVNDHSPVKLAALKRTWPHVRWLEAEAQGVSAARNQAVEAAKGDLLLPIDADDKLAPNALAAFLKAWGSRGDASIIYSDVVMFGQDYAQVYLAPEYSFETLLRATYMTVGSLHRKADWERVGGWRLDMTQGLEDWEYWIALGELGACGKRVPEPLYWYRRHPTGRLAWLKANRDLWDRAYLAMRELHRNTYNGRYPVGCCGGRARAVPGATRSPRGGVVKAAAVRPQAAAKEATDLVKLVYTGTRKGGFQVVGGVSRTRYQVGGQGKLVTISRSPAQGVKPADVRWFLSINGGKDFRILEEPVMPEPIAPRPEAPVMTASIVDSEAWTPAIMEEAVGDAEIEPEPKPSRRRRSKKTDSASVVAAVGELVAGDDDTGSDRDAGGSDLSGQ
jgi:GT2 family glycosyltransferase